MKKVSVTEEFSVKIYLFRKFIFKISFRFFQEAQLKYKFQKLINIIQLLDIFNYQDFKEL